MEIYGTHRGFLYGLSGWSLILVVMCQGFVLANAGPSSSSIPQGQPMSSTSGSIISSGTGFELSFETQQVSARQGAGISIVGKVKRVNYSDPIILSIERGDESLPEDHLVNFSPNPLLVPPQEGLQSSADQQFAADIQLSPEVPPGSYRLVVRAESGALLEMKTLAIDVQSGR